MNKTTMIRTLATAITLIILTAVIITPLTAFALDGNNKTIARVKPQSDLKVTTTGASSTKDLAPINQHIAALGDKWWNWAFSVNTAKVGNPFNDTTGALCDLGIQHRNLLFLVGTVGEVTQNGGTSGHTGDVRKCTTPIPQGTSMFFPLVNTECSVLEGNYNSSQPGSVEEQLRACATDIINHVPKDSLVLTIDGVSLPKLAKRVQSGPGGFQLTVGPNNPFNVAVNKPTTTPSVADGYWMLLNTATLHPGPHTIIFGGEADFPDIDFKFKTEVTYKFVVKANKNLDRADNILDKILDEHIAVGGPHGDAAQKIKDRVDGRY
jgi:hypothetical protein